MVNSDCSIQVGSSKIQPSTVDRDLGLKLESELFTNYHVTKVEVAAIRNYHLRHRCQIYRRVGQEVTTRLMLALVI